MRNILKALGIPCSEIAKRTGMTRQGVFVALQKGRGRPVEVAGLMIEEARFDPDKMSAARRMREDLEEFFESGVESVS